MCFKASDTVPGVLADAGWAFLRPTLAWTLFSDLAVRTLLLPDLVFFKAVVVDFGLFESEL